jgi:hypothetical protein
MNCPYCAETTTQKRTKKTKLGYTTYFCQVCRRTFNERTGTPFNYLEVPTDIVLLAVLWRLRYKLSLRDVAEMFLARGFVFTHKTVRDWEARFAPLMADQLRTKRRGQAGYPGTSMKPISKSTESGAIFIELLIQMVIWLIQGSAKSEIWMPQNSSSNKL